MKNGAPGECPTNNLYEHAMNSPQSHQLAVGSRVKTYVIKATRKVAHPNNRFQRLKLFIALLFKESKITLFGERKEEQLGNWNLIRL